jgi:N-acetylglucosaminyl-diphospho-decaprenol L-rhamnosyltransferase
MTALDRQIDAVVVSYCSRATLRECVEPLVPIPGVRVTVVDNDSPDDSAAAIADLPVEVIRSGHNGGFGFGCNRGLAAGSNPLVLFLNPDAQIEAAELSRLVDVLEAEPDVALVGPRLLNDTGELIPTIRRLQRPSSVWAEALYLHRILPGWVHWAHEIDTRAASHEQVAYPEWVSGACMLARRDALEAIGGFDEGFFLYCEDMDLCARLRAAGGRIRYEPSATVRHRGGHSAPYNSLRAVLTRSRIRYARRHGGRVSEALVRTGVTAHALTHVLGSAGRPAHRRGHQAALQASFERIPV